MYNVTSFHPIGTVRRPVFFVFTFKLNIATNQYLRLSTVHQVVLSTEPKQSLISTKTIHFSLLPPLQLADIFVAFGQLYKLQVHTHVHKTHIVRLNYEFMSWSTFINHLGRLPYIVRLWQITLSKNSIWMEMTLTRHFAEIKMRLVAEYKLLSHKMKQILWTKWFNIGILRVDTMTKTWKN